MQLCNVHYMRSAHNVAKIGTAVPLERKGTCLLACGHIRLICCRADEFVGRCQKLIDAPAREFDQQVDSILNDFPRTAPWMKWYLHEDRAPGIFKVLKGFLISCSRTVQCFSPSESRYATISRHTNSQESIGRDIKRISKIIVKLRPVCTSLTQGLRQSGRRDTSMSLSRCTIIW